MFPRLLECFLNSLTYSRCCFLYLSFAAGVLKEMFDASQGGYVEHGDILATTLGGVTVSVTIPLFTKKKKYRRLDKVKGGYKYD